MNSDHGKNLNTLFKNISVCSTQKHNPDFQGTSYTIIRIKTPRNDYHKFVFIFVDYLISKCEFRFYSRWRLPAVVQPYLNESSNWISILLYSIRLCSRKFLSNYHWILGKVSHWILEFQWWRPLLIPLPINGVPNSKVFKTWIVPFFIYRL